MELGLKGRTAVIAGASMGIGKACAKALAAEGVSLVLLARGRERLAKAAAEIRRKNGVEVLAIPTDITHTESVNAAATTAAERFGQMHVIVNSVGPRMRRPDRQILWDDDDWAQDIDTKTIGMLRVIRAFLPHTAKDGTGRVINVGGLAGSMVWEAALTHGINNAAMRHATGYLARDLAAEQITVNVVMPGLIATEWRQQWASTMAEKQGKSRDQFLVDYCREKGIIAGRWGEPEEVASSIVFLASDRARYLNGVTLVVDGGAAVNPR